MLVDSGSVFGQNDNFLSNERAVAIFDAINGFREDLAISASNLGGSDTGRADGFDDGAIALGYDMVQQNPNGLSREEYLEFVLDHVGPDGVVEPPVPAWIQTTTPPFNGSSGGGGGGGGGGSR